MLKQYIKMAIQMLKENPLVSTISILGTALSIAMIMILVLVYQIELSDYAPESNRSRTLYMFGAEVVSKDESNRNRGGISINGVKEYFYPLTTPEAITAIDNDRRPVSLPGKRLYKEYDIRYTDTAFWTVFDNRFIEGKPFSDADFQSGIRAAVINEQVARELFGATDVTGKIIIIDFMEFTIRGVVREASKQAHLGYFEVCLPYTSDEYLTTGRKGNAGSFNVCLLAKDKKDFETIRNELEIRTKRLNDANEVETVSFISGLLSRTDIMMGSNGFKLVKPIEFWGETGSILLFLLLVPALNLTGVTQSSVQRRRAELGIRKSFGATPSVLWTQIISENLVTSAIGGLIGFGLSFVLLFLCRSFLLADNVMLSSDMLFQPGTFILALLFVVLLNLLSASIPAIRITRQPIVDSIKNAE